MKKTEIYWDIECYINYFYVRFHSYKHNRTYEARLFNDNLELGDRQDVDSFIRKHTLIGFNTDNYDLPMLAAFLQGATNKQLKSLSDTIINSSKPWWMLRDKYPKLRVPSLDCIDLVGATPLIASLKTYACRIHTHTLEDLPLHPSTTVTPEQVPILENYCANDLDMTYDIHNSVREDIQLRQAMTKTYGMDMRSKSGPQIAEAVLRLGLSYPDKRTARVRPFKYQIPSFISFSTPELWAVYDAVIDAMFTINKNGYAELPDELNQAIEFAGAKYKMGIGGLHSQEKHQAVLAGGKQLGEWDVGSMYPSIILGQSLYPEHIGEEFCDVYREIFDERMAAKAAHNQIVSDSLKLVLNSSFGKFGSKYSFLYSPELLIQTTLTGQLSLLMLIEMFHTAGIDTVSANTDGVVVHHDKDAQPVVDTWQERTGYQLEWTPYQAIYSESVNSYIALKEGGGSKLKGTYAPGGINKGYQHQIVTDALVAYLEHGIPLEDTIRNCHDIRPFLIMRGIREGGVWRDQDVGRVARWYISTDGEPIRYRKNGNKVAGSDNAHPIMVLGAIPDDLDRDWYIEKAIKTLPKLGVKHV